MAFPWRVIRAADLASAWIVEDIKLGLDLAAAGHAPLFCPTARVTSQFAVSERGVDIQRRRWEHGHIVTILKKAPRFLGRAIARGNFNLLALTLDLAIPPLSLLTMSLILVFGMSSLAAALGLGSTALIINAICIAGFVTTVCLAWVKYGRDALPAGAIVLLPGYILGKLGLYRQVLFGKMTAHWIGTDRT
jgi:cellulose synthase/poly-beta-1,6-N-acetylglucosamine synthase-like glycosyltransferase